MSGATECFLDKLNDEIDFGDPDPGDGGVIRVTKWNSQIPLVSAGAETRTLPLPHKAGQRVRLTMVTDGGDIVVTVTGTANQTGNNTLTFGAVEDTIVLESIHDNAVNAFRWEVCSPEATTVALSTV